MSEKKGSSSRFYSSILHLLLLSHDDSVRWGVLAFVIEDVEDVRVCIMMIVVMLYVLFSS
jgi:hypothetical protein